MRFIYSLIFYMALPLVLLRLLWRAIKAPAYARRWQERFAIFPKPEDGRPLICLHSSQPAFCTLPAPAFLTFALRRSWAPRASSRRPL